MSESFTDSEAAQRRNWTARLRTDMGEVVDPDIAWLEDQLQSPEVLAYDAIWRRAPALPGSTELISVPKAMAWYSAFRFEDPKEALIQSSENADGVLAHLSKMRIYHAQSMSDEVAQALAPLMKRGLDAIVDRTLLSPKSDRARAEPALPHTLVHAATSALIAVSQPVEGPETSDLLAEYKQDVEALYTAASTNLRRYCQLLQQGEQIRAASNDPYDVCIAGALNALGTCYRKLDSEEAVQDTVATLLPLYMMAMGQMHTPRITQQLIDRIVKQLPKHGIDAERFAASLSPSTPDIDKYVETSRSNSQAYFQHVDEVHAGMRTAYYAKRLVDGLADGTIDYVKHQLILQRRQEMTLGARAMLLEEQAEARRRERDAVQLSALQNHPKLLALPWKIFYKTKGAKGEGEPTEPREPPIPGKKEREQDPYRIAGLMEIHEAWPGSAIGYYEEDEEAASEPGTTKTSESQTKKTDDDKPAGSETPKTAEQILSESWKDYVLLVMPRLRDDGNVVFDALAESPYIGDASYFWPAECGITNEGEVLIDFTDIFGRDKPHARKFGALQIKHPRKAKRNRDPALSAGNHRDRLLEFSTTTLEPMSARLVGQRVIASAFLTNAEIKAIIDKERERKKRKRLTTAA